MDQADIRASVAASDFWRAACGRSIWLAAWDFDARRSAVNDAPSQKVPIGDIVGCSPKPSLGGDVTCQIENPFETDLCEGQKTAHLLELGCVHSHLQ